MKYYPKCTKSCRNFAEAGNLQSFACRGNMQNSMSVPDTRPLDKVIPPSTPLNTLLDNFSMFWQADLKEDWKKDLNIIQHLSKEANFMVLILTSS